MNYNVLLISEQKLIDNSPLDPNLDKGEVRYAIQQGQIIFIQETLGTNFFEQILDQVQTGDINLPANIYNKELLNNFIQPTLIAYAYYLVLDNLFVKAVNIGLQSFSSEQSQPIGIKEFQYMKNSAKDRAQFLDNLMRRHLVFEQWKYPKYSEIGVNKGQLIPEFAGAFKTSITLPTSRRFTGRYGVTYGSIFDCPVPFWYGGGPRSGE
jgi:hypothetical protein